MIGIDTDTECHLRIRAGPEPTPHYNVTGSGRPNQSR